MQRDNSNEINTSINDAADNARRKEKRRGRPSRVQRAPVQRQESDSRERSRELRPENNSLERNSRRKKERKEEQQNEADIDDHIEIPSPDADLQDFIDALRQAFIVFFAKIGQGKGLVFTAQEREKLRRQEVRSRKKNASGQFIHFWNACMSWNKEKQYEKVNQLFNKANIQSLKTIEKDMKEIFVKASVIFAEEFTNELYYLLLQVVSICLKSTEERQQQMEQLTQCIANGTNFKYFNFQFSPLFKLKVEEKVSIQCYQWLVKSLIEILEKKVSRE